MDESNGIIIWGIQPMDSGDWGKNIIQWGFNQQKYWIDKVYSDHTCSWDDWGFSQQKCGMKPTIVDSGKMGILYGSYD